MDLAEKWDKELELISQARLSIFEFMIEDRVKNYKYTSVYHHLSKATEALEAIILDSQNPTTENPQPDPD
jgi:hypothetical protein